MKIVAIVNQKGGVGKSSTALALYDGLRELGKKCLFIDLDSQCNSSYVLGVHMENMNAFDLFNGVYINNTIYHTPSRGDVIAGSKMLATVDKHLAKKPNKQYILQGALEKLNALYDYVIIDTPPALGLITLNALVAADEVIIPALADIFSLQGIKSLAETIYTIKSVSNSKLKIKGILLTKYNNRAILNRDVFEIANSMAKSINTVVFNTTIREAISVREAQISKESIYKYAPKGKVTDDYRSFIKEFLERVD